MKLKELSFILFLMFLIAITPLILDTKLNNEILKSSDCKLVFTEKELIHDCKITLSESYLNDLKFQNEIAKSFLIIVGLFLGLQIIGKDIKGDV